MKKGIKYGLLVPGMFFLGILLLVLLAALLIQTEPAKRKIARIAETQVDKIINGNLTVGKIDGNFFTGISIQNVTVTMEQDTLVQIDEIKAKYNLWSLLRNTLEIHSAEIIRPQIFLKQVNDSVWNVQQIVKPGAEKPEQETEPSEGFNIRLPIFHLVDGFIRTETTDTIIPQRIEKLNTKLSLFWSENEQKAHLRQFSFSTKNPDFSLTQLEFLLTQKDQFIELQNFKIETAINQINGKAGFSLEQQAGNAHIEISELNLSEFSYFMPYLKFPATPSVKLEVRMEENIARATLQLEDQNQQISLQISSSNLTDFLFGSGETILSYALDGTFSDVDLIHWLGISDLPYTLNGNLSVKGHGIDPKTAEIELKGELNNWVIQDKQLDKITFDFSLNNGNLAGLLQGKGQFGSFSLSPSVQNLFNVPVYKANFTARNLDLERLTGMSDLSSDINLTASFSGRDFDPEKIRVAGQMNMLNSRFQHIQIDTLLAKAAYQNQNLRLDTLRTKTRSALLTASGNYSFTAPSDFKLEAVFSGVDEFYASLPDSSLQTSGTIQARLWGMPDALSLETTAELDSSRYGEITLAKLSLNATGQLTTSDTLFDVRFVAQQIRTGDLLIDSLAVNAEGNLDSLFISANLAAYELTTLIEAGIVPREPLKISLTEWEVVFRNQKWALQQPPAIIELDAQNYRIENFNMISDHQELEQFISANGIISLSSEQDFQLKISNLNLENMMQLLELEQPVTGLFGIQIDLTGKPDSMQLNSRFSLAEPGFDKFKLKDITGKMEYTDNYFHIKTIIAPNDSGRIEMSAAFPLEINPDSLKVAFSMKESITGKVKIENISLAMLKEMEITDQLSGIFEGELDISGTVENPVMTSYFTFSDTEFSGYRFLKFDGNMNYSDNLFSAGLNMVPQDNGKLVANAEIPVHFYPDSLKFGFNPKDSVNGKVILEKMTLELLQALYPAANIAGFIEGDLNISGTMESPNPLGNVRLRDATVEIREFGIDYKNVGLNLNFLRDKIRIENLLVRSRDGSLTGSGQMDFASDFYQGDISQSEIELKFNRFQPFNHRQFNMQMNGNATFGGKKGEVAYGGNITIPRSEIYIPTVMRMLGRMTVAEMPKPLLVQEMERMTELTDSAYIEPAPAVLSDSTRFDYFDNFKGSLRIRIPRNTWIKNDDLYIELSGDVELRKSREYFELFGTVDVVRGQYDLLGKTFMINEGSIRFQGGEDMMPSMDITASYAFRNPQRVEQTLSVQIGGTAESPEVNFRLDGSSISEGDAISYILFGKSMNELTIDEQDNMDGPGGGSLAGRAAASILTSQLTNFLGEKLAVDYIEVKSDGGFDNATVVVGKYITNDLFVSYEQRFGETHEKDMVKYEVKLEYELFRFLFLELNNSSRASGFDVILKFDAK
ncbi:MAG: translocation/assembly module TamB domain-containing protein [Mariniphaga sp.]|nr:translocation/assembly module TamB domain-containing protein [Mariniphaga sp.]